MKLAIVGSRAYTNKTRMKTVINYYQKQYNLIIISGGCPQGADWLAKQLALEMTIHYHEYPPSHVPFNQIAN